VGRPPASGGSMRRRGSGVSWGDDTTGRGARRHPRARRLLGALSLSLLHIANALIDQHVNMAETDGGVWAIYFNTVLLATLDERDFVIRG
jgi:hypothetical protein